MTWLSQIIPEPSPCLGTRMLEFFRKVGLLYFHPSMYIYYVHLLKVILKAVIGANSCKCVQWPLLTMHTFILKIIVVGI